MSVQLGTTPESASRLTTSASSRVERDVVALTAEVTLTVWPACGQAPGAGRAPHPHPDQTVLSSPTVSVHGGALSLSSLPSGPCEGARERERERCASSAQTPTGPWKERRTCETQVCRALCHADGSSWEPQETRAGAAADSCTLALGGRAGLGLRVPVRQSLATANGRRVSPGQMSAVDTPETERTSMHRLISLGEKKKTKCGCVRVAFRRKKTESRIDEQEEVAASD